MEEKIGIITDSSCDLDSEFINKYNINVLPLRIAYANGEEYRDGVDITPNEVYERMSTEVPKTSLPSPAETKQVFEKLKQSGYTHVIALHISSGLSGTYDMVKSVASEISDIVIEVIDTKALTIMIGFMAIEAAKMIEDKVPFYSILQRIKALRTKISAYYVIKTLEYLKKGGRIGLVAGTIGEFLDIKPIIGVNEDGKYFTVAKCRGRKQSLNKLYDIVSESIKDKICRIGVMQGGAQEEVKEMAEKIRKLSNVKEVIMGHISPALGVHTGPGLVALVVQEL